MEITTSIVQKLLTTVDAGLVKGLGEPVPGKMCVEAAVCYALGRPHNDDPGCVDANVRSLKINLNDADWSSPEARAAGMRRLAVAQLGTKDNFDSREFLKQVQKMTIRTIVPLALRAIKPMTKKIEAAAVRCEQEGTREAALAAARPAANASYCAALAALAARYAADAAANASYCAAEAASAADAAYCAALAARYAAEAICNDIPLEIFAEGVVQILISMNTDEASFWD